jgi:hypothetical protein
VASGHTGYEASMNGSDSTVDGLAATSLPVAVWLRRFALFLVVALVLAALAGLLGVHTSEVTAEQNGYRLTVRYPATARAGLDTRWQVVVSRTGGFDDDITLALSGNYLDMFETQGFHPEPAESTRDSDTLFLTFTAPDSDTLVVDYDAYIQPSSQRGHRTRVAVVEGTTPVIWVDIRTRLFP